NLRVLIARNSSVMELKLPNQFHRLSQLEVLFLGLNDFVSSDFLAAVFQLPKLTILEITSARLSKLPNIEIENQSLKHLILSNNGIQQLPNLIGNLKALEVFDLSNNPMSQ